MIRKTGLLIIFCILARSFSLCAAENQNELSLNEYLAASVYLSEGDIPLDSFTCPAQSIYVDVNGEDANNGTSIETPFMTIERAIEYANNNVAVPLTIYIREGTYAYKGTLSSQSYYQTINRGNLYIKNYNNETVVITSPQYPGNPTNYYDNTGFDIAGPYENITFDGLSFKGWGVVFNCGNPNSNAQDLGSPMRNLVIKNCIADEFKYRDGFSGYLRMFFQTGYVGADVYGEGKIIFDDPDTAHYQLEGLLIQNVTIEDIEIGINIGDENDANVKGMRLSGLTITNPDSSGGGTSAADGLAVVNCYKVLIDNCHIENIGDDGIDTKSYDVSVMNTYVEGTGRNAVKYWRNGELINSIIYNCTSVNDGILIIDSEGPFRMVHSAIITKKPFDDGIVYGYTGTMNYDQTSTGECTIINSIFMDLPNPVYIGTSNLQSINTVYYQIPDQAEKDIFEGQIAIHDVTALNNTNLCSGNSSANPQLSDIPNKDFDLTETSPCINTGISSGYILPTFDFYGNNRSDNPDIGPIEYSLASENESPIADAGEVQSVTGNTLVSLDGSGSNDPDEDSLIFLWTQTSGIEVTLSTVSSEHPTFIAPVVNSSSDCQFQLRVSDPFSALSTDTTTVTITPLEAQSWPYGSSTEIGGDLYIGYEPSGVTWHSRLNCLFLVGDDGDVTQIDSEGTILDEWHPGGDLEGITIADHSGDLVYLGRENPDAILEFNIATGALTGKSWDLTPWMSGPSNSGLEALAFVPNGSHPYSASSSGGLFYAGLQADGKIYVFDIDLIGSSGVTHIDTITPVSGRTNLQGLYFDAEDDTLYLVYGGANRLALMQTGGTVTAEYVLPGSSQEGVALSPEGLVFIAEDVGNLKRYGEIPPDETPPIIDDISAGNSTNNSVRITFSTDETASGRVSYGLTSEYGSQSSSTAPGTVHSIVVSSLSPDSVYHFQVTATDTAGNGSVSEDHLFQTELFDPAGSMPLQNSEWFIYDTGGSLVNEYNAELGDTVLRLAATEGWRFGAAYTGSGGFVGDGLDLPGQYLMMWVLIDPGQDFTIFVNVIGEDGHEYYLTYVPDSRQYGSIYQCYNIGAVNDGQWHMLFRNIDEDLQSKLGTGVARVRWFCLRGQMLLGGIRVVDSFPVTISVSTPEDGSSVAETPIVVAGSCDFAVDEVTLEGEELFLSGSDFSDESYGLTRGENNLEFIAYRNGASGIKQDIVAYEELSVRYNPADEGDRIDLPLAPSSWFIYDTGGSLINEHDPELDQDVLYLASTEGWGFGAAYTGSGSFSGNGLAISGYNYLMLDLQIRSGDDFTVFVNVLGENGREYYLTYTPDNRNYGGMYLCYNVGSVRTGSWETLIRDLDTDLYQKAGTRLEMVRWFCMRGRMRIASVSLLEERPSWQVSLTPSSWFIYDAGGSLVSEHDVELDQDVLYLASTEGWGFGAAYTGSDNFSGNGLALSGYSFLSLDTKIAPGDDFTVFVNVVGTNGSEYYLTYAPDNRNYGGMYLCYTVGSIRTGSWETLARDLDTDLYQRTGTHLAILRWFCARGRMRIGRMELE